jgi:hypothetical protein
VDTLRALQLSFRSQASPAHAVKSIWTLLVKVANLRPPSDFLSSEDILELEAMRNAHDQFTGVGQ